MRGRSFCDMGTVLGVGGRLEGGAGAGGSLPKRGRSSGTAAAVGLVKAAASMGVGLTSPFAGVGDSEGCPVWRDVR
jgi:hypothetical protein